MKVLGIESASLVASVAMVCDGQMTAEYTLNLKKTHSQTLLPMIDQMMDLLGEDIRSVDAIAVSGGPGSFTGLRIGAATAKGIGFVTGKPLVNVPTMDAMAYGLYGTDAVICPMLDARRKQAYTGLYRWKDGEFLVLKPQWMAKAEDLAEELSRRGEPVVFLGDGADACRDILESKVTVPFAFAPVPSNRQRGASVAALGEQMTLRGETVSAAEFRPDYLRKSQAERERDVAERQGELEKLAAGVVVHEHD